MSIDLKCHDGRFSPAIRFILFGLLSSGLLQMSCGGGMCSEPLVQGDMAITESMLSTVWTNPANSQITLVVTDGPYRISDASIELLKTVLTEQAGLSVNVVDGVETGFSTEQLVSSEVALKGYDIAQDYPRPTMVVLLVDQMEEGTYAASNYCNQGNAGLWDPDPALSVIVMQRRIILQNPFADQVEGMILVHETGHFLEVPARDNHTTLTEPYGRHCTYGHCAMYDGGVNSCSVMNNLGGIPTRYCDACAEELNAMKQIREQGSIGGNTNGNTNSNSGENCTELLNEVSTAAAALNADLSNVDLICTYNHSMEQAFNSGCFSENDILSAGYQSVQEFQNTLTAVDTLYGC